MSSPVPSDSRERSDKGAARSAATVPGSSRPGKPLLKSLFSQKTKQAEAPVQDHPSIGDSLMVAARVAAAPASSRIGPMKIRFSEGRVDDRARKVFIYNIAIQAVTGLQTLAEHAGSALPTPVAPIFKAITEVLTTLQACYFHIFRGR